MLRITREQLTALGACDVDSYLDSPRKVDDNTLEYPDGWTSEDTDRLLRKNPDSVFWLIKHNLIPVTVMQAAARARALGVSRNISTRKP